jgi:FkbM family methyltransferase
MLDLGARGGVRGLSDLRGLTRVFGFEANPNEAALLERDWHKRGWLEARFYPAAVSDSDGDGRLILNRVPGTTSFLEPNWPLLKSFGDFATQFEPIGEEVVPVVSLDRFAAEEGLTYLDYVKVDVQGSELPVIMGGRRVLAEGGLVLRVEMCFQPLYRGQPVFRDIDSALAELGFTLLAIDNAYYPASVKSRALAGPQNGIGDRGEWLWCDTIYAKDVLTDPSRSPDDPARELAFLLVLESEGFVGYALEAAALFAERRGAGNDGMVRALAEAIRLKHRLQWLDRPAPRRIVPERLARRILGRRPYIGRHVSG